MSTGRHYTSWNPGRAVETECAAMEDDYGTQKKETHL